MAFKKAICRAELNVDTRVVTVTFKGKQTAEKWVGWSMPLGMKMLKLVDYEAMREDAEANNSLIKLDFYRFSIVAKKGSLTSSDLYWILTQKLNLRVQSLGHVERGEENVNDKQWTIVIKHAACPKSLRRLSHIVIDDTVLLIHHHEVYLHWPCNQCGAPEHSARFCRTGPADVEGARSIHTLRLDGRLPSNRGRGTRDYIGREHPTTVDQLLEQLKGKKHATKTSSQTKVKGAEATDAQTRPTLPREWEQTRWVREKSEDVNQDKEKAQTQKCKLGMEDCDDEMTGNLFRDEGEDLNFPDHDTNMDMEEASAKATHSQKCKEHGISVWPPAPGGETEHRSEPQEGATVITALLGVVGDEESKQQGRHPSPKRQLSDQWIQNNRRETERGSKSPKRSVIKEEGADMQIEGTPEVKSKIKTGKRPTQKFMHQFLAHSGDRGQNGLDNEDMDTESGPDDKFQRAHTVVTGDGGDPKKLDTDGFLYTGMQEGDDDGMPLRAWLEIVGGTLTDVAANGHCGWLAFLVAFHNVTNGLGSLDAEVVEAANTLKKQVMNSMIANAANESQLDQADFEAQLAAQGRRSTPKRQEKKNCVY